MLAHWLEQMLHQVGMLAGREGHVSVEKGDHRILHCMVTFPVDLKLL